MPAHAVVVADPDRHPSPDDLALIREQDAFRLVAVQADRTGAVVCYSVNPSFEVSLDDVDPARIATVVAVLFNT